MRVYRLRTQRGHRQELNEQYTNTRNAYAITVNKMFDGNPQEGIKCERCAKQKPPFALSCGILWFPTTEIKYTDASLEIERALDSSQAVSDFLPPSEKLVRKVEVVNKSATPALDAWNAKYGSSSPEQLARNLERVRSDAQHNMASAIGYAVDMEREKWKGIVAELDKTISTNEGILAELRAKLDKGGVSHGCY